MKKLFCLCLLATAILAMTVPQHKSVEAYDVPIGPIESSPNVR